MKLKLNDLLVKVLDIYLGYLCENKDIYIYIVKFFVFYFD